MFENRAIAWEMVASTDKGCLRELIARKKYPWAGIDLIYLPSDCYPVKAFVGKGSWVGFEDSRDCSLYSLRYNSHRYISSAWFP